MTVSRRLTAAVLLAVLSAGSVPAFAQEEALTTAPVVPLAVASALLIGLAVAAGGDDGGDDTSTPPAHTTPSHH